MAATIVSSFPFHAFVCYSFADSRVSANPLYRISNRHSSSSSFRSTSIIRFRPTLINPLMGRKKGSLYPSRPDPSSNICRAAEYKFPDPIPEFAVEETEKFKNHLVNKLSKKDIFEDSLDEVLGICIEIFSTFLHSHYGGPGTLLVLPFIDMADAINERGLPGGPQAARAAVKWATDHVDKDWKEWNNNNNKKK